MTKIIKELDKFLNFEDEIILNYYHHNISKEIDKNKISIISKDLNFDGGEGGFEPTNKFTRCWFYTNAFNRQPPLLELNLCT